MRLPKISVKNISKNKKATIDFIETPVVTTNIKLNGISCKTWIDTGGAGYLLMTKEMADRCNAKELISGIDSLDVNGKRIRGAHAWVDSIQIGSTIVTRVPAIVVYGDFSSFVPIDMLTEKEQNEYKSVMNTVGIIVGLPLLQKLGSIEFDWDKKVLNMTLTPEDSGGQKANMFTLNNQLYICLDVNTTEFVGMVDIGLHIHI